MIIGKRLWNLLAACLVAVSPLCALQVEHLAGLRPGSEAVAALFDEAGADRDALGGLSSLLMRRAIEAERARSADVDDWWTLHRWAEFLGREVNEEMDRWAKALSASRSNLRVFGSRRVAPGSTLAGLVSAQVRAALVRDPAFVASFLQNLNDLDDSYTVFRTIGRFEEEVPGWRQEFRELGIAIAVVYDVEEVPGWWPHAQVAPHMIDRRLPDAVEVLRRWEQSAAAGSLALDPRRQQAEDLRFAVISLLTEEDRAWAARTIRSNLGSLGDLYDMIPYDHDRIRRNQYQWPHADYRLSTILASGGICVDQSFFGSEIAKSLGVPAIIFAGQGADARHAWFAYLNGTRGWRLDVGRGSDARLVTGVAIDPQTWTELTDHEVAFLAERFRQSPRYREARRLSEMAATLRVLGEVRDSEAFARRAIAADRRIVPAWEILLGLSEGRSPRERANLASEAARAFIRYPDLEVLFGLRAIDVLFEAGETPAAEAEERRLLRKNQNSRPDLSVHLARQMLDRSVDRRGDGGRRTFEQILLIFGNSGGISVFDWIVRPYVERLQPSDPAGARRALELARRHLRPERGSQLDVELAQLEASVGR